MSRNLAEGKSLKSVIIIILTLLLSACGENSTPAGLIQPTEIRQRSEETEAIKIYTLLLNQYIMGGNPILIDSVTLSGTFMDDENIIRWIPEVDQETLTNFRLVTQSSKTFDLRLSLNRDYVMIASQDKSVWQILTEKYPDSDLAVSFSSIGFNENLDRALVYIEQYHNVDYGQGDLYFLTYDNEWTLQEILDGWIT